MNVVSLTSIGKYKPPSRIRQVMIAYAGLEALQRELRKPWNHQLRKMKANV